MIPARDAVSLVASSSTKTDNAGQALNPKGDSMPNELSYEVSLERSNQIRADLPQHPEKYT
ncbi:MAG: hypothetical protein ACLUQW_04230, partial [Collinsella sp.]